MYLLGTYITIPTPKALARFCHDDDVTAVEYDLHLTHT